MPGWDKRELHIGLHGLDAWMYEHEGRFFVYVDFHSFAQEDYDVFIFPGHPSMKQIKSAISESI